MGTRHGTVVLLRCDRCGARSDVTQVCAPCGERLCSDCYAPWTALACGRCRLGRPLSRRAGR